MAVEPFRKSQSQNYDLVLVPDALGLVPPTSLAAGSTAKVKLPLIPEWVLIENLDTGLSLQWGATKDGAEADADEPYNRIKPDVDKALPVLESMHTYWIHNPTANAVAVEFQMSMKLTRRRYRANHPEVTSANGFPAYLSETIDSQVTIQPGVEK